MIFVCCPVLAPALLYRVCFPAPPIFRSLNLVWLVWAVGGGFFLTNFILSSYITILIRPVFGTPLETAEVKPPSTISYKLSYMS